MSTHDVCTYGLLVDIEIEYRFGSIEKYSEHARTWGLQIQRFESVGLRYP